MNAPIQVNSTRTEVKNDPNVDICAYHSDTLPELRADARREPRTKPCMVVADGAHLQGSNCEPGPPGSGTDAAACLKLAQEAKLAGAHFEDWADPEDKKIEGCGTSHKLDWTNLHPETKQKLRNLATVATKLAPRGVLDRVGNKLTWNGQVVTLAGVSVYGSIVSNQVDINGFLEALSMHRPKDGKVAGCNLTRTWLVNPWAATKTGCPGGPHVGAGVTPFEESGDDILGRYDLSVISQPAITRCVEFCEKAWNEGIVVIVTLFERNSLKRGSESWLANPYNAKNAKPGQGLTTTPDSAYPVPFLGCSGGAETMARIRGYHQTYIDTVRDALDHLPNVIIEVMNEPESKNNSDALWSEHIASFHRNVAARLVNPAAVWSCEEVAPPIDPPPPPVGNEETLTFPPFISRADDYNHGWPIHLPGRKFRRMTVDFDVDPQRMDPSSDKVHCLFFVKAGPRWKQMLSYANAVENGPTSAKLLRIDSNFPEFQDARDFPLVFRTGEKYHVHADYNRILGKSIVIVTNRVTGAVVGKGEMRISTGYFTFDKGRIEQGSQKALVGPEARTINWGFGPTVVKLIP